jgi:hypothetical protein
MQIQAQYGGNLSTYTIKKANTRPAAHIKWQSREMIISVLTKIEPYLVLKKEQAKMAMWWAETAIVDPIAKDMFLADLKAMKGNMLLTADASIERIREFIQSDNVVAIR